MGKIGYYLIMLGLVIVSFTPFLGVMGAEEEAPSRAPLGDPFNLNTQSFDTQMYPGETDTFYVRLYNYYDGSSFAGAAAPTNSSEVKEVKIFISGFYQGDEHDPVAVDPVNWIDGEFYNNDGDGYTIGGGSSRYFYGDVSNNYLEFEIKTEGIKPGYYDIGFSVEFRYMVDWDGATQYDWASSSAMYYQSIEIRSFIGGSYYPEYLFRAYEEDFGTENLYAGAMNQLLGMYNIYSNSGTITDVYATLSFPGGEISVDQPTIFNPNLLGTIYWRVDVPADTLPGVYDVEVTFVYKRSGMEITELATTHQVTVFYTPLLASPQSDDLDEPYQTYSRNNLPTSLAVPFTNIGNVDLYEITVKLDLDNTRYIDGSEYVINEGSYGGLEEENIEVEIEDVPVGESRTVNFNGLNFLQRIPPGLYKIPLDYSAYYDDDGSTGNSASKVRAGYWETNSLYSHRDIMRDRTYPEDTNSNYRPYILIEILPDPSGPLLTGRIDSGYNQDPGNINVRMSLRVETYEMYQMKNLIYHIHTDEGSPFEMPYSSLNDTDEGTLMPILRSGLSASSGTSTQSDTFYFYASIREDATPGIHYFKVDVEGFTEFNQPFNTTFLGHISIDTHQPRFELTSVEVGDILADRSVEVTATIMNVGRGGARNLTCFFKSSSTGYIGTDIPVEIGEVGPNDVFVYSFRYAPDGERRYFNSGYSGYVYFSYYDDLGYFDEMMSGNNLQVRFDVYDMLPDLIIIDVDAPLIDSGDEFDVTITVMNMGGSGTSGLRVMLPSASSQFNVEDPEKNLTDLAPGETQEITFTIQVEDEISDRTTYSFSPRFAYTDIMGRERTFGDGEVESFNVRTEDHIVPTEERQVVKDDGVLISAGAGSVILGILIFLALIVFGGIITGGAKEGLRQNQEKDTVKPHKKAKKIEFDEDEEEDEDEDEDMDDEDEDEEEDSDW